MPPSSPKPQDRGEAHIRDRGDACPGALRLHQADDGALARLRLPTGVLTERQVRLLADAADRLGDGHLSLTSRGNIELRGLGASCGAGLADVLREAGLLPSERHERVRNMVVSPLAGPEVQSWAARLDALLCAEDWTPELSGRFLFAVDDGRGDVAALSPDVTLLAAGDGTALLHVAGRTYRVAAADAPRAALTAAAAFLAAARAAGTGAWRVRELPPGQDVDVTGHLERAALAAEPVPDAVPPAGAPPQPGLAGDGTVCVLARLGRVTTAQFRALLPAAEVRVTPWRGFVLPHFADRAAAEERLGALGEAGFITRADSPWTGVTACTGRPGCAKSLSDVRADARPREGALPVHWSGCARRCGHPQGAWTDMVATGEGAYRMTVQGSTK
ncbi:cobalamin biosynthesis protein CobG [Streptomyces sp. WAC05374]|uniref:cobalamin biosynthesis protein CobG n=1 Tax=Streptomyces sp. WAC05374 TaxID=2487420 RepID=UPI001F3A78F9|nr:cobalamin biosynthesis protein CobG [Streptomyces sp. WAC05374]